MVELNFVELKRGKHNVHLFLFYSLHNIKKMSSKTDTRSQR